MYIATQIIELWGCKEAAGPPGGVTEWLPWVIMISEQALPGSNCFIPLEHTERRRHLLYKEPPAGTQGLSRQQHPPRLGDWQRGISRCSRVICMDNNHIHLLRTKPLAHIMIRCFRCFTFSLETTVWWGRSFFHLLPHQRGNLYVYISSIHFPRSKG